MSSHPQRWFRLTMSDAELRKLTRKQYYALRSWLRHCERLLTKELNSKQCPKKSLY